jgi:predicted transcriptional regulator
MSQQLPPQPDRSRLSIELSEVVSSHLSHISDVTGASKAAIVSAALLDALPDLLSRADALKRRYAELNPRPGQKR